MMRRTKDSMKQLVVFLLTSQIALSSQPGNPPDQPHIFSVYQAEVGKIVEITCPLDCTGTKEAYGWNKFSNLSSLNESSLLSSIDKVLKFEVEGVKDGGYYRCFSYCKRDTTAWMKLNVLPIMTISEPVGVKTGETIVLHCKASGFPRPSIVWTPKDLSHEELVVDEYTISSQLTIEDAQRHMSELTYACSGCYPDGANPDEASCRVAGGKSSTVYTSVLVYDPVQLIAVKEVLTELGAAVILECRATIDPRLTYTVVWWHNGEVIDTNVNDAPPDYSLEISRVDDAHLGTYRCVVASLYAKEEASEEIELLLYQASNDSIKLLFPLVVVGIATLVWIYYYTQKKQGKSFQSQWEKKVADVNNQEPPRTSKKPNAQKMTFETFAEKHGLQLREPTNT